MSRRLLRLEQRYAIGSLPAGSELPAPAGDAELWSVTRTRDEVSVLCAMADLPPAARSHGPLRGLRVEGKLDFDEIGVLESLLKPLRQAGLSVLALSTFDTDYLLVAEADAPAAEQALESAGWEIPVR